MSKTDRFWDWIAKRYDRYTRKDEDYPRAVERIAKHLKADYILLDFACGTGALTFLVAPYVREVHAIDTSAHMIDIANERARELETSNVRFAQRGIFDAAIAREAYDVIIAFNILHLVDNPRESVRRTRELLKPGGLLISSTPCMGAAGVFLRCVPPLMRSLGILSNFWKFRATDVQDILQESGLHIEESEVLGSSIPLARIIARKQPK